MTKTFKAFRIAHQFTLPGGRCYRKSDFHRAMTAGEEEILGKAQFAIELAPDVEAPTPIPSLASVRAPEKTTADTTKVGETQPDWAFKTTSAMRSYLDQCGVGLPSQSASKDSHEQLCRDAWAARLRPHPLYGFPGGPAPSAGFTVQEFDLARFADALSAANLGGFQISEESANAFKELTTRAQAPAAPETPADDDDAQGSASGDAGEALAEESSDSTSGGQEAVTGSADDETAAVLLDEAPTEVLPEGETKFPTESGLFTEAE